MITLRQNLNRPLTHQELDDNFLALAPSLLYGGKNATYAIETGNANGVTLTTLNGKPCYKMVLDYADSAAGSSHRSEISLATDYIKTGVRFYSFGFYIPTGWNVTDNRDIVLSQIHSNTTTGYVISPPVTVICNNGVLRLDFHRPTDQNGIVHSTNQTTTTLSLGALTFDKWYKIHVDANWQYLDTPEAYLKVYVDNVLVYEDYGVRNCWNARLGNWAKTGIYQPSVPVGTHREAYFDFICEANGSFTDFVKRTNLNLRTSMNRSLTHQELDANLLAFKPNAVTHASLGRSLTWQEMDSNFLI